MKSHKHIGSRSAGLFLLLAACSANNSATSVILQNRFITKAVDEKTARIVDCGKTNEYTFVVVASPHRKKDSDPVMPKDLNIVLGDETISKIELPKESEVKNFLLYSVVKNEGGFEITVDWGGGLYLYEIKFNFKCRENELYLYYVTKKTFSTTNPDSGNFLDRQEAKVTRIEPNLPIGKFVMTDYL